ncbi:TolC family protein [Roseibacillus ishigakijimensis]|uniref:TolC family protein n=1 Tax=Roseibacillus ishigakijimensis TaxID=454146 RepID=A0A934RP02_9BACT|nr:TolC family protein [Roseibacillus ishigakijimensis]MBK1834325.1 TolC family protein [Roseibacillus ishigakijimensis]
MRLRIPIFLFLINLLAPVSPLAAAAPSGLIVGLDTIPNRIRAHNPALAAARWRIAEARGTQQASGLRDNPELEGGFSFNNTLREGGLELGLSQRFPVTNRLQLEKTVTTTLVLQAEAEVQAVEQQLIHEARTQLVEILTLRQQLALRSEQITLAGELAAFIEEAATKGELSPLDAGQAQLESVRLEAEIPQLKAQEEMLAGRLKALLGMQPADQLHVAGQQLPPVTVPDGGLLIRNRSDLTASRLASEAARQTVALEEARRYDDIEVGVVAGLERSEDAPEGFENEGIVGVRVKMALPFWDKNEGQIARAKATAARHEQKTIALGEQLRNEAGAALGEMKQWSALLHQIDSELLPLAEKQAVESESAYRQGLGDLQAYLRVREQRLDLANSRLESLRNFHLARLRYEAALGQP